MMTLGEKIRHLRHLEGALRGYDGALSKAELVRLLKEENGATISVAYVSQLENGRREHMTAHTRDLLARFFRVHPGYLVSDPPGFSTEVKSVPTSEDTLDTWLTRASIALRLTDRTLAEAIEQLAADPQSRDIVLLMAQLSRDEEFTARLARLCSKTAPPPETGAPATKPRNSSRRRKEKL